jgi:hypothetical protein
MKKISAISVLVYLVIELLLFGSAFCSKVLSKSSCKGELTIKIIIACCIVILPMLFTHLICDTVRNGRLTTKNTVIATISAPLLGTLLFGLYYAWHGVSFMFSGKEYGFGAFLMGAISGFVITIIGVLCIIAVVCAIYFFSWLRPIIKTLLG